MSRYMAPRTLLALLLVALLAGCGGAGTNVDAPDIDASEPLPSPRDADELARAVVGAKLTAFVRVDRVRDHPLAPRLLELVALGAVFEGSGIEPLRDVDRAFVAAARADDQQAVIALAEHHVEEATVRAALEKLITASGEDGRWLEGYEFPAAQISVRGRKTVVLAVTPTMLAITSPKYAKAAARLQGTGGLPDLAGEEAAIVGSAEQPSKSLKARGAPPVPATISHGKATITFREDGGADVAIDAQSSDPQQAKLDADQLTRDVEDATTIKVAVIKLRAFGPIDFKAEGSKVVARRKVSKLELERLLSHASLAIGKSATAPSDKPKKRKKPKQPK